MCSQTQKETENTPSLVKYDLSMLKTVNILTINAQNTVEKITISNFQFDKMMSLDFF